MNNEPIKKWENAVVTYFKISMPVESENQENLGLSGLRI
jgi:hypothetical protein